MQVYLIWTVLIASVVGLYEDQVGKFDWKQSYIGKIKELGFHTSSVNSVIVAITERNVVAGLDADSGSILWRHAFESDDLGNIWDIYVSGRHSVTVSGSDFLFIRLWDSVSGALIQEHLVKSGRVPDEVKVVGNKLVMLFYDGSEMEIITHSFDSKKIGDASKRILKTPFQVGKIGGAKCVVSKDLVLVCAGGNALYSLDLGEQTGWSSKELAGINTHTIVAKAVIVEVETTRGIARYNTVTGTIEELSKGVGNLKYAGCGGLSVSQKCTKEGRNSQGLSYCNEYEQEIEVAYDGGSVRHTMGENRGSIEMAWGLCEEEDNSWQLVLSMEDSSLLSITPRGNLMFVREEGLANLKLAQMVGMGSYEDKYEPHKPSYSNNLFDPQLLVQNFISRIKRHVSLLQSLFLAVTDFRLSGAQEDSHNLEGDKFGLRKIVVGVTNKKMYGLDSKTGNIVWQLLFPGEGSALHILRDGRTDNNLAQAVLVYKHARSTYFLLNFNPVTGSTIKHEVSPFDLDQVLLLPELPHDCLRPLLLVGKDLSASVYPEYAVTHVADAPKMFVVTEREGTLTGNLLTVSNQAVSLTPVWNLVSPGTKILKIRTRRSEEKVHSAGRVMADRSVLFKYMNPNLALVMSEGLDSSSKTFITVQVVDLVTGKVFFSATHKKVLPPFHSVHSENWAVYSYFNDKARRTELVSLEMYEGKEQANATIFSSIDNMVVPLVERQAYILPISDVVAIEETITGKGITSKHLLVASSQGSVLDLPLHMVDPRRPALSTPAHLREPGIPPYTPELPVPHESILNYNQSVEGIQGIVTSPSGLESTVLVFIHGLDLYGTRIAPSKGFDLIKDDFEHLMIAAVLVGLLAASYGTRKLSQRKMLNQAWK